MLLSTQTEFFTKKYGYELGISKLCEIGYDCLDLTLTHLGKSDSDILLSENYLEIALKMKEIANTHGVSFNQCHAPYRFKYSDFLDNENSKADVLFRLKRSIEIAGLVGAKVIVIHPIHHRNFNAENPQYFFDINMDFYGSLSAKAKSSGVKIALENMWQRNIYTNAIMPDVCSNPHEFANYIDALNERYGGFVACLDIGHCALTGVRPEDSIRVLSNRLEALHVHDNNTTEDEHLLPFNAKIDFFEVMKALKEVGYRGELTFEADKYLKKFPTELDIKVAEFMEKTGRFLISLLNN